MHDGDLLINTVAENCDNTIVVVQAVGPVDMEKWIEHPNVTAVVWANLGVYTIAKSLSDYAQPNIVVDPQPYPQINYTEGISVDYRGFEKNGVEPRFWFGHGLSHSNFTYGALEVSKHGMLDKALKKPIEYIGNAPGGDMALYNVAVIVQVTVTNDGNPTKVLRGFVAIPIRDGETQNRKIYPTRKDISYWDVVQQTWITPSGTFNVHVGASAADIRVASKFTI
ncbi:glycoside hydrolase family 3 protein [Penicillium angulare]|uniref:glycoside hydrolase family 3 protein n=1 Tax=Penicillium angulare TaxID=116970 RepID=UPI00254086C4|nr:glycoside hydrolase family 3 protein [Penicillium angulare]KAJ5279030.1 glycoside hydrolase family 3 protein [Penicillium angulare]